MRLGRVAHVNPAQQAPARLGSQTLSGTASPQQLKTAPGYAPASPPWRLPTRSFQVSASPQCGTSITTLELPYRAARYQHQAGMQPARYLGASTSAPDSTGYAPTHRTLARLLIWQHTAQGYAPARYLGASFPAAQASALAMHWHRCLSLLTGSSHQHLAMQPASPPWSFPPGSSRQHWAMHQHRQYLARPRQAALTASESLTHQHLFAAVSCLGASPAVTALAMHQHATLAPPPGSSSTHCQHWHASLELSSWVH
jgi:hypothetical protein